MKISVITPTYNRSSWLKATVDSIMSQEVKDQVEYIVVDNNSSDDTKEVIHECIKKYHGAPIILKYLYEGKPGINNARNTGIAQSDGDYVIFFDDDIVLEKGGLQAYIDAFKQFPQQLVFGGKIKLLRPDFSLPAWLATSGPYLRPMIVYDLDYGDVNFVIQGFESMPIGLSMAVKRTAFEKYGVFRTDLGLTKKKLMPGAEYELFLRFSKEINGWVYVADGLVYHPIKKEQACKSYFRKRLFGVGRVTYRLHPFEAKKRIFGLPLYILGFIVKHGMLALKYAVSAKPMESFFHETEMFTYMGCVREHFAQKK